MGKSNRQRKSIALLGLDTTTPNDSVKDGACAILDNMRYEGGAWRSMGQQPIVADGIHTSGTDGVKQYYAWSMAERQDAPDAPDDGRDDDYGEPDYPDGGDDYWDDYGDYGDYDDRDDDRDIMSSASLVKRQSNKVKIAFYTDTLNPSVGDSAFSLDAGNLRSLGTISDAMITSCFDVRYVQDEAGTMERILKDMSYQGERNLHLYGYPDAEQGGEPCYFTLSPVEDFDPDYNYPIFTRNDDGIMFRLGTATHVVKEGDTEQYNVLFRKFNAVTGEDRGGHGIYLDAARVEETDIHMYEYWGLLDFFQQPCLCTSAPADVLNDLINGNCNLLFFDDGDIRTLRQYSELADACRDATVSSLQQAVISLDGIPDEFYVRYYPAADVKHVFTANKYEIVYKHPALEKDEFIAVISFADGEEQKQAFALIVRMGNSLLIKQTIGMVEDGIANYKIDHFGQILIIRNTLRQQMYYYQLHLGVYTAVDASKANCEFTAKVYRSEDSLSPDVNVRIDTDGIEARKYGFVGGTNVLAVEKAFDYESGQYTLINHDEKQGTWRGSIAVFAAVRDEAGGVLYKTPVQLLSSVKANSIVPASLRYKKEGDEFSKDIYLASMCDNEMLVDAYRKTGDASIAVADHFALKKMDIELSIPEDLSAAAHSIALYSTRLFSLLDETRKNMTAFGKPDYFAEPFYLMQDCKVSEFVDNKKTVTVDWTMLQNLSASLVYEPAISFADLYGGVLKEYNGRLHLADISQKKPRFDSSQLKGLGSETGYDCVIAMYEKGGRVYHYIYDYSHPAYTKFSGCASQFLTLQGVIKEVYFANRVNGLFRIGAKGTMTLSSGLDLSYIKAEDIKPYSGAMTMFVEDYPKDTNRIQVSANNDCFVYPYTHTYNIGSLSSRVLAMNSVAMEQSDAKFGEFQLYAFTDEGIFALQNGQSTLYGIIDTINYNVIANPCTLAVNNNVIYITKDGVHALAGRTDKLISSPVYNSAEGGGEWLRSCALLYYKPHNEVVFASPAESKAFVYSCATGLWTTRSWRGIPIGSDLLVHDADNRSTLLSLSEEEGDVYDTCEICTRPFRLDSLEFKRIETLVARIDSKESFFAEITLEGSMDSIEWQTLIDEQVPSLQGDIRLRRTPFSATFFRFYLMLCPQKHFTLASIDVEFYLRMLHRLR